MRLTKKEKIALLKQKSKVTKGAAQWKETTKWNRTHADIIEDLLIIAGRIRHALKEQDMTQKQLAEMLEVTPQALTRIMKGRQNLTLQTMRRLEAVLGTQLLTIHKQGGTLSMKTKLNTIRFRPTSAGASLFQGNVEELKETEGHNVEDEHYLKVAI